MTQTVSEKRETHVNFCNAENHFSVLQRMRFAERLARIGYWELDLQSKRFYWSSEMYQIFGIKGTQISSRKNLFREQILPEDMPIYKQKIIELIKHQNPVQGEIRIRHLSGQIIYCRFTADIRGNRVAGTFQNISDWIHQLQVLQKAQKKAEDACRSKSYFLAQASHDLRQPLQALQLFTDALGDTNPSPEQKPLIKKIDDSVVNFRFMLDNMLDLSKIEFDKITPEYKEINLTALLKRLCSEYKTAASQKDIHIRCHIPLVWIYSDYLLIERIIRNLLSNALKYTKNKIIISCSKQKEYIVIRIIDNGVGIDSIDARKIFEDFYQSQKIANNRQMGAGLGLSIVKKLTTTLKGKIKMRSSVGKYTVFSLYLPHKL